MRIIHILYLLFVLTLKEQCLKQKCSSVGDCKCFFPRRGLIPALWLILSLLDLKESYFTRTGASKCWDFIYMLILAVWGGSSLFKTSVHFGLLYFIYVLNSRNIWPLVTEIVFFEYDKVNLAARTHKCMHAQTWAVSWESRYLRSHPNHIQIFVEIVWE